MTSNRQIMACTLNGADFSGIDEKLYIEDIQEVTTLSVETDKRPGHGRTLLNAPAHDTIQIKLRFMVKERDREARMSIISAIQAWAVAGWLTVSYRSMQRIFVYPTEFPPVTAWQWTNRLEITFTAFGEAYWQDIAPVTASGTGASGTASLTPLGTDTCYLEAEITPSAALTSAVLTVNGRTITLSGISVASGKTLTIHYDTDHRLCIDADGVSLLAYRTGDSADDLLLIPKQANEITFTFSASCAYEFQARGIWR